MVPRMEPSLIDAFKQNPLFFLIACFFGGLGLALSLLGLILASRGSKIGIVIGLVAVLSGFGALGSGVVGWVMARNMVEAAAAAPGLSASDRSRLMEHGTAEALYSLEVGIAASALPLLIGMGACGLGIAKRKPT
jgi:hypothetical protein